MLEIIKKNKKSKEERIITLIITISIAIMALAGSLAGKYFTSPEAQAAIILMVLISEVCLVAVWIGTTISLREKIKSCKID